MKKILFLSLVLGILYTSQAQAQVYEYKVITTVESIIPNGIGRSRLIESSVERDYEQFTTQRTENQQGRNKSKRRDIRVKDFEETKLLNFFNIGGIRFQNIAANDALVSSKLSKMSEEGWELAFVNTGVESHAGTYDNGSDDTGIFITRFTFRRLKQAAETASN